LAICLDDIAASDELLQGLGLVAEQFAGANPKLCRSVPSPNWLSDLPTSVRELHQVLTRWNGIITSFPGGFGEQDFIFLPPDRLDEGDLHLIEENQGGFYFRIRKSNGCWIGRRVENAETREVRSIEGYLVSFALQEMVMSAPLWAIDEGMEGLADRMMADMTLIWTDKKHGDYMPHGDVRFYWHKAGALVLCDERGHGVVGCHDVQLSHYFEGYGFYDIR
jgi:hypothetical protein